MFLFGGGNNQQSNMIVKGKRGHKWGGGHHHHQHNQGGWQGQQNPWNQGSGGWNQGGNNGWGQQGGNDGWGQQGGNNGWGQQGSNDGWGQQQGGNNGWGQQGGNDGWGQQQGGNNGWGQQGGNNSWGQQGPWNQNAMGFIGGQDFWGNNLNGGAWVEQQRKRNEFNIFSPGNQQNFDVNQIIGKQIILLEPSPAQQRLQELEQTGEPFLDEAFPPNEQSLTGEHGPKSEWSAIEWIRASDIEENPQIISGRIEPGDIKQGYLGDCYFLAGIAALAERPDRIFNLFLLQEMNQCKYFSVKMLYKGKWQTIDMDEYIPCLYGKPAFSKSIGNELWVMLLEKAWAKLYTSYLRIEAGYAEQAMHDLTGAPMKYLYFQHSSFDYERDWRYLVEASIKEYSMVGSTQPGSDTTKSVSGVVQGHAYTILNATEVNAGGSTHRIVQCRNPWGKGEFHGKWSDGDEMWDYVSEQEKTRVGYNPDKSDGIFFIGYDDFIVEFRALTIAQIDDDASYVYKSYVDGDNKGVFFKIEIFQADTYSFHLDKTPERIYPESVQQSFSYPLAYIQLGRLEGGDVQKYQAFQSRRRTLYHKHDNLQPGTYIVHARIDYDRDYEDKFQVNLAVYAGTACNITLASHDEAVMFTGDPGVQWSGMQQEGGMQPQHQQGGNNGWGDGW